MRKFWLLFAQATTVGLAALFIIQTLKPSLLPSAARNGVVTLYENTNDNSAFHSTGFSEAAKKVMPAVVNIYTSSQVKNPANPFIDDPRFRFFFGDQFDDNATQQSSSLGSGVIVSHDGYILTNHHVIEGADQIEVALADGRTAKAHIVGSDPDTDLAVIKIELANNNLHSITFAHAEQSRVGDIVLAIGNPFGVGQTVTMGIVSALKRNHLGLSTFENFIQTDAAINPGNSGGALVNVKGNLIGINSAIYSPNGGSLGIGFAIPVSTAKKIMEQIIQNGSVTRGWIGVAVQDLTPELAESFKLHTTQGVLISEVMRGSPADKAGIKAGDILTSVGNDALTNSSTMLETISALTPGKVVLLKLQRNQAEVAVQVKVGKRPRPKPQQ